MNRSGAKTVWVKSAGKSKERITAMLLGDSDGNKYPPFLVAKSIPSRNSTTARLNNEHRHGFGRRVWVPIEKFQEQSGIQVYGNPKGWWNAELSIQFLRYHFAHREDMESPILLIWDAFQGHWTEEVREFAKSLNVIMEMVPPRFTFICQPADVSWNKPLKDYMRVQWTQYLMDQLCSQVTDDNDGETSLRVASPTRIVVFEWFSNAWGSLSSSLIASGFLKLMPTTGSRRYEPDEQPTPVCERLAELLNQLHLADESIGIISTSQDIDDYSEEVEE